MSLECFSLSPIRNLYIGLSLLLAVFLCHTSAALALEIQELRFGKHQEKSRMVLDLSEKSAFRVFVLSDPYRLVIDLPSFEWKAQDVARNPSPSSKISAIRYGNLKPGISRVVFDLSTPIKINAAFILPAQNSTGKPDRLVIDFTSTSSTDFITQKNRVLGTLDIDNPKKLYSAINTSEQNYRSASLHIPKPKPAQNTKKPLVVIDPGHGGVDPGAIGPNKIYEKKVVLALAKELRRQLLESGQYRVLMTRESDVFIKLRDRVKFARDNKADLFVSIHADSIEKNSVRGASVYTLSEKASDKQTARLAARENKADLIAGVDLSVEDEQVASILVDLTMRDTTNQGKYFANKVVESLRGNGLKVLQNPHRHAGFAVLKAPDVPSLLIEAGFMSNKQEAEHLNTPAYRRQVAQALKRGISAYFDQVKKNQRR